MSDSKSVKYRYYKTIIHSKTLKMSLETTITAKNKKQAYLLAVNEWIRNIEQKYVSGGILKIELSHIKK